MAIIIKKRITLEFLGDEYKDSYLVFSSMSLREYEELMPRITKAAKDGSKSLQLMKDVLVGHFIEGKFEGKDLAKADLIEFDIDTLTKCFETLSGTSDPKVSPQ